MNGENLNLINGAVSSVAMNMGILEAKDKVRSLHGDYIKAPRSAGYETIPSIRPHIARNHILGKVNSHHLMARIADMIDWQKNEQLDKKDFNAFMREAAVQAKQTKQERGLPSIVSARQHSSDEEADQVSVKHLGSSKKRSGNSGEWIVQPLIGKCRTSRGSSTNYPIQLQPPCLNLVCRSNGGKNFIQNCPNASGEDKVTFWDQYRANKETRTSTSSKQAGGTINKLDKKTSDTILAEDALLEACFLERKVLARLMTDQGANANFMPCKVLEDILANAPRTRVMAIKLQLI